MDTIQLKALTDEIKARESKLAPGSETPLWGDYLERMRDITGVWAPNPANIDESITVPRDEAIWWRAAYDLYERDPEHYANDRV